MRLLITTPTEIVVDDDSVVSVRAEDESGGFGVLHGHVDFLTALSVSVVAWRRGNGKERYCAVRRGVFSVSGGKDVAIATREAVVSDDLDQLEKVVVGAFKQAIEEERSARTESLQMQMRAIRQIVRSLRPGTDGVGEGA